MHSYLYIRVRSLNCLISKWSFDHLLGGMTESHPRVMLHDTWKTPDWFVTASHAYFRGNSVRQLHLSDLNPAVYVNNCNSTVDNEGLSSLQCALLTGSKVFSRRILMPSKEVSRADPATSQIQWDFRLWMISHASSPNQIIDFRL